MHPDDTTAAMNGFPKTLNLRPLKGPVLYWRNWRSR
jgi:hypothetical protein